MLVRAMTYNIRGGLDLAGRPAWEAVAEVIEGARADVVGLQEVYQGHRRVHGLAQPAWFVQRLGLHSAYLITLRWGGCFLPGKRWGRGPLQLLPYVVHPHWGQAAYGTLLLSRWPITVIEERMLPALREQRGALVAAVEYEGQRLGVVHTHLGLYPKTRMHAAAIVAEIAASLPPPWLVLGDLNDKADSRSLAPLLSRPFLCDAGPEAPTFRAPTPRRKIDYILVHSSAQVVRAEVMLVGPSDHFAVVADIRWPD